MKYFSLIFIAFSLLASPVLAASLRQQAVVEADVITLGDLFHGVEHGADRVLGAAPRPGQNMVLSTRTLMRVAKAMSVSWYPASTNDHIVVRRAATVVEQDFIEERLRETLKGEGVDGLYKLKFLSGTPELILPPHMEQNADVVQINYDPKTGWFEAEIAAPSKHNVEVSERISGRIERLSEIPVLRDTIRSGTVIRARDVQMLTVPTHTLHHNMLLRAEDLHGLTPRRMITAGKPVKEQDVEYPRIVKRGENVTMIYKNGPLQLTALGKALEFGAKGDVIRVVNNQTSRSIDAIVSGEREVTIKLF